VGPLLIVNTEINIIVLSKNSLTFVFLYFSKFHEFVIEYGILQKYFFDVENQNLLNWDKRKNNMFISS
jgi:hypothetical protein